MLKLIGFFFLFFWGGAPATYATVEVALQGKAPQQVKDVYLHQGLVYLALDDLLPAVSLRGDWDAVRHIYFIRTPEGRAELSPGAKM